MRKESKDLQRSKKFRYVSILVLHSSKNNIIYESQIYSCLAFHSLFYTLRDNMFNTKKLPTSIVEVTGLSAFSISESGESAPCSGNILHPPRTGCVGVLVDTVFTFSRLGMWDVGVVISSPVSGNTCQSS